jgi:hypothetical protein
MEDVIRTKVFLSYATEDSQFALWLYRKLTIYGYDIWIDHESLRKGSSFTTEFPKVISEQAIKFLAVMSHHSKEKDNPLKERHIANETKKKIGDSYFIIPLKITKDPATDFITCNLNWIDFTPYWAKGLADLIKELETSNVPKRNTGLDISELASGEEKFLLPHQAEDVYTNLISIEELPHSVYRLPLVESSREIIGTLVGNHVYAFALTPETISKAELLKVSELIQANPLFINTFKNLVQKTINASLSQKGMLASMDRRYFAFPVNGDNKIKYTSLTGKRTYIKTKGFAKTATYFTTASYTFELDRYGSPKIVVSFKFSFVNDQGKPYAPKLAFKKQMNLRKNLWNVGWLKKILALSSFLADGKDLSDLLSSESGKITIKGMPDKLTCYQGISDQTVDHDSDISDDLAEMAITEGDNFEQHRNL